MRVTSTITKSNFLLANADFISISGLVLLFSSLQSRASITVTLLNDAIAEDTEDFTISLQLTQMPAPSRVVVAPDTATINIEDMDGKKPRSRSRPPPIVTSE